MGPFPSRARVRQLDLLLFDFLTFLLLGIFLVILTIILFDFLTFDLCRF